MPPLPFRAVWLALGLFGLAAQAEVPWQSGESRGEDLAISLVTFGPGDEIASWFGHSALVVEDRRLGAGRLYNYGMFSFDQTMLARFAMGRLTFWVSEDPVAGTLQFYLREGRDVRIQELNLSPAQRLEVARVLATNALPQNRDYLYHHFRDNCATRPRDVIDRALGGQLQRASSAPARMTLRDHARRHTAVSPPMSLLLDFLMNDEIDRPISVWDEGFLPSELERQVAELRYLNQSGQLVPLVARSDTYHRSSRPPVPERPPSHGPWLLLLGFLSGVLPLALSLRGGFSRGRWPRVLFGAHQVGVGLTLGLPGLVLFLMWLFTEHTVTWRNENLLLANPLTFLALPMGLALVFGSRLARAVLERAWLLLALSGILALAIKVFAVFDQDNWSLLALCVPLNLGTAGALLLDRRARRAGAGATIIELASRRGGRAGSSGEGRHGS